MTTRFGRTARSCIGAVAASIAYLAPESLHFGAALAGDSPTNRFYVQGTMRDFKPQTVVKGVKTGHPDFDKPTAASIGLTGSYTAGLVMPFPYVNGKLGKGIFENDPVLDWSDEWTGRADNMNGISAVDGWRCYVACGTAGSGVGAILRGWDGSGLDFTAVVHTANKAMVDIDMVDANNGWAIGLTGGYVVKTADAGASWDPHNTTAPQQYSVAAPDALHVFISASAGKVYRTTDGHATPWGIIDVGAGATNLLGICFLDNMTGWVVGANGTISRTTSGGGAGSWIVTAPTAVPLRGIWAHDALKVWVVGNNGTILRSIDGGATWTPQASGTATQLNAVTFAPDGEYGLAVGNGGLMLQTSNGGTTWSVASKIAGAANLNDVVYICDPPVLAQGYSGFATGYASCAGGGMKRHGRGGVQVTTPWAHTNGSKEARQMSAPGDTAGGIGAPHCGFVTDPATMVEWYTDMPGQNISAALEFQFDRQGLGPNSYFLYDAPSFYPMDDKGFGNPPGQHNWFFTLETDWLFTRDTSRSEWLYIQTNGDCWVYINEQLVVDMGGTHDLTKQYVDIDRLGLTNGTSYHIKIYQAERMKNVTQSLMIATNVYMWMPGAISISDVAD